jgi:hypothetical protein
MAKIIWYPPSALYLREPLLQELQTRANEAVPGWLKRHRRLPIMFPSRINPSFVCLAFVYAVSTVRRAFSPADLLRNPTLKRYALINLVKDDIDGQPCFVIELLPQDTCTDAQREALRRFRRWFIHRIQPADS